MQDSAIPKDHSAVIPYFVASNVDDLIAFLINAFDAREVHRSVLPDGTIVHAHLRIGDSSVMMGQAQQGCAASPAMIYTYVQDVDATFERAMAAGGKVIRRPADQFYGDRAGAVKDPAGNQWWIATRKEEIPEPELVRRATAARQKN